MADVDNNSSNPKAQESQQSKYILAVDVGTTVIRCYIYDQLTNVKAVNTKKISVLYPKQGWVEMEPDTLWTQFVNIIKDTINDAKISITDLAALGISSQRNTFLNWDRETGRSLHNFIVWSDLRGEENVNLWNRSTSMKCLRGGSKFLYTLSGSKKFMATSIFQFNSITIPMKLIWMFENNLELKRKVMSNEVLFGTIPTWLVWRLTAGQAHVMDYSNASATLMFDTFQCRWSDFLLNYCGIPVHILPRLVDTSSIMGHTDRKLFGAEIPIASMVGDQQAAMFGQCCFDVGDMKCTLGTATFIDINTGSKPHTSQAGLYPLIGWKIGDELVYLAEGHGGASGTLLNWAASIDLVDDISRSSDLANSVNDTDGVYFVPSFNGLYAPINDPSACAGFLGLTPSTSKVHMLRAVMDSVAFRAKQLYETILKEADFPLTYMRVDGGVSNSDFIMQLISDLCDIPIDRPEHADMSSLGAAFLAGLATGVWSSKSELVALRRSQQRFTAEPARWQQYKLVYLNWERAVKRCSHWY